MARTGQTGAIGADVSPKPTETDCLCPFLCGFSCFFMVVHWFFIVFPPDAWPKRARSGARATGTGIFQLVAAWIRGGIRGGAIVETAQGHAAEDHGIPALRVAFHVPQRHQE